MNPESWVAIYAAIVATGALALEVRRWFETGPRIKLRVQPNMAVAGDRNHSADRFVVVTVRNRGTVATTITTLAMVKYPNRFYRFIRAKGDHFIIPKPTLIGYENTLPHVLEPGQEWLGMINKAGDAITNFEDGTVIIEVYTSDKDSAYRFNIPRNKAPEAKLLSSD